MAAEAVSEVQSLLEQAWWARAPSEQPGAAVCARAHLAAAAGAQAGALGEAGGARQCGAERSARRTDLERTEAGRPDAHTRPSANWDALERPTRRHTRRAAVGTACACAGTRCGNARRRSGALQCVPQPRSTRLRSSAGRGHACMQARPGAALVRVCGLGWDPSCDARGSVLTRGQTPTSARSTP